MRSFCQLLIGFKCDAFDVFYSERFIKNFSSNTTALSLSFSVGFRGIPRRIVRNRVDREKRGGGVERRGRSNLVETSRSPSSCHFPLTGPRKSSLFLFLCLILFSSGTVYLVGCRYWYISRVARPVFVVSAWANAERERSTGIKRASRNVICTRRRWRRSATPIAPLISPWTPPSLMIAFTLLPVFSCPFVPPFIRVRVREEHGWNLPNPIGHHFRSRHSASCPSAHSPVSIFFFFSPAYSSPYFFFHLLSPSSPIFAYLFITFRRAAI